MSLQLLQNLNIQQLTKVKLNGTIVDDIVHFPNGDLKPAHEKIKLSLKDTASKISVFSFYFVSNNQKVKAYFLEPKQNSNKCLIFFNRSGTGDFGKMEHRTLFTNFFGLQDLLEAGFSIVINQLPGVDGGEGLSDAGGTNDLQSFSDLYDVISKYPAIHNQKIGMIGGSSGGLIVYQSARKFDWVKTGVIIASPTDEATSQKDRGEELKSVRHNHFDTESMIELEYRSPILWANEISNTIPLLIMHGTSDWRVDVTHSLKIATKLYQLNKPFRLKIYEGADHSLSEFQKNVSSEIVSWFADYLLHEKPLPNLEKHGR
jgi:dipeptidyl aminopeptidase/acylaminoacyl peptidase